MRTLKKCSNVTICILVANKKNKMAEIEEDFFIRVSKQKRIQYQKDAELIKLNVRNNNYYKFENKTFNVEEDGAKAIIAIVSKDGEFVSTQREGLLIWDIHKNPNYDISQSVMKTNTAARLSIYVTGLIVIISCIFQIRSWHVSNEQLSISKSQYILDSLKHQSDSLTIDGLKEKIKIIQKQLDDMQKPNK